VNMSYADTPRRQYANTAFQIVATPLLCWLVSLYLGGLARADVLFESGAQRVSLLELYTSEGCSSCPPAEKWMAQLRNEKSLWNQVVPVAFHVDYWDSLGWKDRFAKRAYSARQRDYASSWGTPSVYTPGFVLNGTEWKGWFDGQQLPTFENEKAGQLKVHLHGNEAEVVFDAPSEKGRLEVHFAPLAMRVASDVRAGENQGRKLEHEFVATELTSAKLEFVNGKQTAHAVLPLDGANALAVWVTRDDSLRPLQATGGFLN
jgi:hypothetical protein